MLQKFSGLLDVQLWWLILETALPYVLWILNTVSVDRGGALGVALAELLALFKVQSIHYSFVIW